MLSKLMKNLLNDINVICFVGLDQDAIQINDHKDIKIFYWYFIDVFLKATWCVGKAK